MTSALKLPVHLNDTSLTITTPSSIINNHEETLVVSDNPSETTRSGIRVKFPEHLDDY